MEIVLEDFLTKRRRDALRGMAQDVQCRSGAMRGSECLEPVQAVKGEKSGYGKWKKHLVPESKADNNLGLEMLRCNINKAVQRGEFRKPEIAQVGTRPATGRDPKERCRVLRGKSAQTEHRWPDRG